MVTSTSAPRSALTAESPPNPPPTTTTFGRELLIASSSRNEHARLRHLLHRVAHALAAEARRLDAPVGEVVDAHHRVVVDDEPADLDLGEGVPDAPLVVRED